MTTMVYTGQLPPDGQLKLVDYGQFAISVDCVGRVQPCVYCSAQKRFKSLGMAVVMKGKEYGRNYEIWRERPEIQIN